MFIPFVFCTHLSTLTWFLYAARTLQELEIPQNCPVWHLPQPPCKTDSELRFTITGPYHSPAPTLTPPDKQPPYNKRDLLRFPKQSTWSRGGNSTQHQRPFPHCGQRHDCCDRDRTQSLPSDKSHTTPLEHCLLRPSNLSLDCLWRSTRGRRGNYCSHYRSHD